MEKSFKQGDCDGLCGIYSIVNAIGILKNLSKKEGENLFEEIFKYLEKEKEDAYDLIINGMNQSLLNKILKFLEEKKGIKKSTPFWSNADVSLDSFWNTMKDFLSENKNGVILLSLEGVHSHWTVVQRITETTLMLFDSDGLQRINRAKCTTKKATNDRPHQIEPIATVFISVEK